MSKIKNNAQILLTNRYFLRDENGELIENTWGDIAKRVAKAVSFAENTKDYQVKWEKKFYEGIDNMDFIPSSPCLFNAGSKHQQLSSCFIVSIDDSIEDIFKTVAECAKIFQMSGGAGFNIGRIRPKGFPCKSSGSTASGIVSFMYIFNEVVERVKQGNKRNGALMVMCPVSHPEVIDFIRCKSDTNNLQNMNISVGITDAFMEAVEKDKDWTLEFKGVKGDTVKAKWLWDLIIEHARKNGEPGLLFINTMEKGNMNTHITEEVGVNPCSEFVNIPYSSCIAGDSKITTKDGVKNIRDMVGTSGFILSEDNTFRKYKNIVSKGIKKIYEIKLENEMSIKATIDHKFFSKNGIVELGKLKEGDEVATSTGYPFLIDENYDVEYEMYGWMHGDGWYSSSVGCSFNSKDGDFIAKERLLPVFNSIFRTQNLKPLKNDNESYQLQTTNAYALAKCEELGFIKGRACDKKLPKYFYNWDITKQISFIRGLFSADGFIFGKNRREIALASTSLDLLKSTQAFLESIGIQCRILSTEFKTCDRKAQHKLVISGDSSKTYFKVIGFLTDAKNKKFNSVNTIRKVRDNKQYYKIKSINHLPEEEVYDVIEVEKTNNFYCNGVLVHNCNLASINLTKITYETWYNTFLNKKTEIKDFNELINIDKLKDIIKITFRFLDDMISVNKLPLDKIQNVTNSIRPIGLGTLGFAHLLYKLGIPYDSKECLDFIDYLYGLIKQTCDEVNMELADEKGVYPKWKGSKWDKELNMKIRCSSTTSIAPNGSIAFIADTTGGIEPQFALAYTRIDNEGNRYFVIDAEFEQFLIENNLYNEETLEIIGKNNGSIQGLNDLFDEKTQKIFVTANDISPEWHVNVLTQVQKYINLSISKTVNMPKGATLEEVSNVYKQAWENGAKGVTVYVDGSRDSQVLVTNGTFEKEKEKEINVMSRGYVIDAPEESSECKTVRLLTGCGTAYLTMTKNENDDINQTFVHKGSKGTCLPNQVAVSRLTSLALRGGIPVETVIDQLKSVPACTSYCTHRAKGHEVSHGSSCPSAIAFQLEAFSKQLNQSEIKHESTKIENNKEETDSKKCPECGEALQNRGGCVVCTCGWSRCG